MLILPRRTFEDFILWKFAFMFHLPYMFKLRFYVRNKNQHKWDKCWHIVNILEYKNSKSHTILSKDWDNKVSFVPYSVSLHSIENNRDKTSHLWLFRLICEWEGFVVVSLCENGLSSIFTQWNRPSRSTPALPQRGPVAGEHVGLWRLDLSDSLDVKCLT